MATQKPHAIDSPIRSSARLPKWRQRPVWPASQNTSADWPRRAEAGGRPALDLALAGRFQSWRAHWPTPLGGSLPRRRLLKPMTSERSNLEAGDSTW
eukprot:scaffold50597_cov45-Phaeocystis_antarctica.AAC.2